MNTYAIFLCDEQWRIIKPLRLPPERTIVPGARLTDWLTDPALLTAPDLFDGQEMRFVVLPVRGVGEVPALLRTYPHRRLAALVTITCETDFIAFSRIYERCTAWAQEAFREYQDEYYTIEQINNQLINSQRALTKSNARYKQALTEVQSANNLITLLEQDEVTALLRRSALFRRARACMEKAPDQRFAMMAVDLEPLKLVNEICGWNAGTRLLQNYAMTLTGLEHAEQAILAHSGGNSFLIFAPAALRYHEVIRTQTEAFLAAYPLPLHLRYKLGICIDETGSTTPEELCDRARLALGPIRPLLHSASAFYTEELNTRLLQEHKILDSIPAALEQHQLQLYLQPKVRIADGSTVGAEALVRWNHPELGLVSPGLFIPLLEREGAIYTVDQAIWEQACAVLAARRDKGLAPLPISINIARSDFYQPDFRQVLQNLLEKYHLTPDLLHLEVLERAYTRDSGQLFEVLTALRQSGFVIEMDDFGVGESSLAMLTELPVDIIKLDRQFLLSTLRHPRHAEVIRCIIRLAGTLDIGIIAEGVETPEQAQLLADLGCRYAQGYFYGRPAPAEQFLH